MRSNSTKLCRYCGNERPATAEFFSRHKQTRDGLHTMCRSCKAAYDAEYRARTVEKRRAYFADYYRVNAERLKAATRDQQQRNRVAMRPLKRAATNRRRARERELEATFTETEWAECKAHFGGCAYCGATGKVEQDHFVPLTLGGHYRRDNIVPACRSCNPSKGNRAFAEWYPRQVFYSPEREAAILSYLETT
jgi:5-methylcytosine-specific restriction endonuclease McrA